MNNSGTIRLESNGYTWVIWAGIDEDGHLTIDPYTKQDLKTIEDDAGILADSDEYFRFTTEKIENDYRKELNEVE